LAGRGLEEGRFEEALTLAQLLIDDDPVDEEACETAVRAHLGRSDVASALREFRRYRDLLLSELEIEPSERLRRLAIGHSDP
jgi:DNA-binding SARP family transcriptional activator